VPSTHPHAGIIQGSNAELGGSSTHSRNEAEHQVTGVNKTERNVYTGSESTT